MRAIVIGSGISGLSAAIALREVGIEVALYERTSELREVGAGISLWANALRALDYIRAGAAVRKVSLPMVRSEIRCREGYKSIAGFDAVHFERKFGIAPFVCMAHRAELVNALASYLPAEVAHYGFECREVIVRDSKAAVRFTNGHEDSADIVIGADGIHSVVRASLFGQQAPRYAGYTCWRGVCPRPESIEPGYLGEWWGRGKRFGITTLPGDRIYWFATHNSPQGQHEPDERSHLVALFRGWADPVPKLLENTPPERVIRNDIIDRPPTPVWSKGRAVVIGDAAHPTTPNLGQGGCTAIEDAVVLARNLSNGMDPSRALAAFTEERYGRTAGVVNESWRFGRVAQWEGALSVRMRDWLLGLIMPLAGSGSVTKYAAFDVGPVRMNDGE